MNTSERAVLASWLKLGCDGLKVASPGFWRNPMPNGEAFVVCQTEAESA